MVSNGFDHIEVWVFDLDNTLYPPEIRLFDQIERLMTGYVSRQLGVSADDASRLRQRYWAEYGTTLAGLMDRHGVDPDPYLREVHDIDLSEIPADPALAESLLALSGRRIVYTNGSRRHAERVTEARGIRHAFHAIYGIEDAGYVPKPQEDAYRRIIDADGLAPAGAAMFDDDARNLLVPFRMGMRTVLVGDDGRQAEHVHHRAGNLADFLSHLA